jgi:putative ABC transport system substrate-binding protein
LGEIRRRQFLTAAAALLAAPRIARAQAQKRLPVLGILSPDRLPSPEVRTNNPFVNRLRELGWSDGKTITIERAYAEGNPERLPELAATLVAKKVDVIWTARPQAAVAAARATSTIPIVFFGAGFPVELGLVNSLAKPGRNVTGVTPFADESIYVKRYQLLRELAPDARRIAILGVPASANNPTVAGGVLNVNPLLRDKVDAALRNLGIEYRRFEFATTAELEPALAAIAKWAPNALSVLDVALTFSARKQIVEFARRHRLIDIYESIAWTQAGGLFSYGTMFLPAVLRTADMVDRILRGTKPSDLPVELPSHYEMVVNLGTAKALGFKVPQSILLRADKVIE